jgi:DNA-binding CsgD family transcriptional regulator
LLRLIKEIIGVQLVVEVSAEQFAFRHALTRQAIYADLLARERQVLHRQVADALERKYADALDRHLETLAYHVYEAGDWAKALVYAEKAGDRAQALYAPRAAVEQFTRALEAARALSIPPPVKLYRGRGLAYETLGDFERAQDDLEVALELARAAGAQPDEWQVLLDLGLLWTSRDYARAGDYYRRALTLARTMDDPALLAHSLNRLGNWHVNVEQPVDGQRYHEEALATFRGLEDRRGTAETLDLLGLAAAFGGDLVQAASYWEQAIALFREVGDRRGLASCLASLTFSTATYETVAMTPASIGHSDAIGMAEEALRIAREIGWRAGEALVLTHLPLYLGLRGDYARAFELARRGLVLAEDIEHRQWLTAGHCCLGVLHLDVLALPAARQHLEHALALAQDSGSQFWSAQAGGFLALACVAQRDFVRAGSVLDAVLAFDAPARTHGQRLALCARGELALARGAAGPALEIANQLVASATNIEGCDLRAVPRLAKLRGEALALLHRPAEAQVALEAAAEGAVDWNLRSMLWRIDLALGKLYRAQRCREDAERELAAARSIVNALASELTERSLRDEFLHRATALFPPSRPPSPRRAAKQAFGGLTEREREVAALVAQSKTNRQIAEALVVSEVTIVTHVGNILAKLGFSSRVQIASWAVERGLAHIS